MTISALGHEQREQRHRHATGKSSQQRDKVIVLSLSNVVSIASAKPRRAPQPRGRRPDAAHCAHSYRRAVSNEQCRHSRIRAEVLASPPIKLSGVACCLAASRRWTSALLALARPIVRKARLGTRARR
jgi:hypothetical protein